ncbi:hypothetical protein [Roseibium alexandrii]|uniref:Uncharacterized protein n=1 Tax=Roseibium alexandrii TaxID=388408 RepID=A0A0M7ALD9_9HYPH|nr:hypothetical protein [Roseibium alexandrii]CTQ75938.1 hypothetical protein LAX5112_04416 [Roseibium alexandrii]
MTDLSDDAKAIAAQFHTQTEMTFKMIEARPSDRYQAGLDELVKRNLLTVEPFNQFGGLVYKKVPEADYSPYMKWFWENPEKGKFPITTPIRK